MRIAVLGLATFLLAIQSGSGAACTPWPDCGFEAKRAKGQASDVVRQAKENSVKKLLLFNRLNVLDVSDEIVGAADIRALVGAYAYFEDGKKTLQIIGPNFDGTFDKIQFKDRRLFSGIVKRGFDSGLNMGVLKVGLARNQVAELVIDDIAFASIKSRTDEISCNFPLAFRDDVKSGKIRPVFIKSAAISRIRKRYFTKSKVNASGTYLVVSANGSYHVSEDTTITHFVITPQVVPALPAAKGSCPGKQVAANTRSIAKSDNINPRAFDATNLNRLELFASKAGATNGDVSIRELTNRLDAQKGFTGKLPKRGNVITIKRRN